MERTRPAKAAPAPLTRRAKQGRSVGGHWHGTEIERGHTANREPALSQARHYDADRLQQPSRDTPRSSEPILIPKLRIRFADFPYLHYSID
jgi:hypothetical protein